MTLDEFVEELITKTLAVQALTAEIVALKEAFQDVEEPLVAYGTTNTVFDLEDEDHTVDIDPGLYIAQISRRLNRNLQIDEWRYSVLSAEPVPAVI